MSQERISIIKQAFKKFDKTGDGIISIDDLKGVYSAREHPKVKSGEKTEDEVLREFLDVFDKGNKDGKVKFLICNKPSLFNFFQIISYLSYLKNYFRLILLTS